MKQKKKIDKAKLFTRILAGIMAFLMVSGIILTLIYYIQIFFYQYGECINGRNKIILGKNYNYLYK